MDIIMCGVGGQGTVLASRVLGDAAIKCGYQVRTSEIIGMSQREGSVVSQVRIGHNLSGPLIPDKTADFFLGFELAEAVRNLDKLSPSGKAVINTQKLIPPSCYLGVSSYNESELLEYLKNQIPDLILIDALELARQAGSVKAVSAVMLGAFTAICPQLNAEEILNDLIDKLPEKVKSINTRAFNLGKKHTEG